MAKKTNKPTSNDADEKMDFWSSYKKSPANKAREQKPLSYINFPPCVAEVSGLKGFPVNNCSSITGYSDTGKTTLLIHLIIECQKNNIYPIIISTEGKFSFEHAKFMGMDCDYEEIVDEETGELVKVWNKGNFLFRDGFENLEELYDYIIDYVLEPASKKDTKFPQDICIFVDSLNKLKCAPAMDKIKEDKMDLPMHNAKVHKNNFSGYIEPLVTRTRYKEYPINITFIAIMRLHAGSNSVNPKETGGLAFVYDMAVKVHFGGMLEAAVKKLPFKVNGKTIDLAKVTKIRVTKNHFTGISTEGELIITPHGFISATDKSVFEQYKKDNKDGIIEYFSSITREIEVADTENVEFEEIVTNEE